MNKELFFKELENINIFVNNDQLIKLDRYFKLLVEWNEKVNLTRIIDEESVYLKHFYDSLTLIKAYDLKKDITLCDIGTGAGFPGIVLKIIFPNLKITLIDALQKRVNFLNLVINELNLTDIVALHERCEEYGKINRNKFDIVTSRAVANLSMLIEFSIPILKKDGLFIAMKSDCDEEIRESNNILRDIKAKIIDVIKFSLPIENSNRSLVIIKKIDDTPGKYPRKFDKIKRK